MVKCGQQTVYRRKRDLDNTATFKCIVKSVRGQRPKDLSPTVHVQCNLSHDQDGSMFYTAVTIHAISMWGGGLGGSFPPSKILTIILFSLNTTLCTCARVKYQ